MRKKLTLILFTIVATSIVYSVSHSNNVGAIAGKTGSPGDGQTCSDGTNCHGGTPTPLGGLITSNVPISGYIPGTVYTITATVTDPSLVEFGFEISPQDESGNLMGTITITDPLRTHFAPPGSKYITHSEAGTIAPSHTNVWQFNWTAPATGSGIVTFYGAFNYANSDDEETGDVIHTSTLTIPEGSVGINDFVVVNSLVAYPNPAGDYFELTYYLQKHEVVQVNLYSVNGSFVKNLLNERQVSGKQQISVSLDENLTSGIYWIQLKAGNEVVNKKLVKL